MTQSGLSLATTALGKNDADPEVRRLGEEFGGSPTELWTRRVGVPTVESRRIAFAGGGEIFLHDDAVVAVALPMGWYPSASTLNDLARAFGSKPHFAGFGRPYFDIDGGYARVDFVNDRGWKEPGNLERITVTATKPGLAIRPEDDACATCGDLLARDESDGVDVDATIGSLAAALDADLITQDAHWVRLGDMRALHASRLMARVESQLRCTTCRRIMCFVLRRDEPATFGYFVLNDAERHTMDLIPPVEQWGDADRIAKEKSAMRYVDHEPGAWFLVEQDGAFYLDARYSYSAIIDDSALIPLDASEAAAYRAGGHDYISGLARDIHNSAPYREESPFYSRNLYRGADFRTYRDAVAAAIVNHTWLAQQRNP